MLKSLLIGLIIHHHRIPTYPQFQTFLLLQLLEVELKKLIEENEPELFIRLQSIPKIGKSTAMFMIVISESFKKFESAKQFICYIGLSPVEKRSGSSVRGRSGMSKQGNGKLRNLLFLCSFNACKSNRACKSLYDRIVAERQEQETGLDRCGK